MHKDDLDSKAHCLEISHHLSECLKLPPLKILFILFRERGWEGGRKEKNHQEPNPQPRPVPWLEIKPAIFHFVGWCPTHWATRAKAEVATFKKIRNFRRTNNQHSTNYASSAHAGFKEGRENKKVASFYCRSSQPPRRGLNRLRRKKSLVAELCPSVWYVASLF